MVFCHHHFAEIQAKNPTFVYGEIGMLCADAWMSMTSAQQAVYTYVYMIIYVTDLISFIIIYLINQLFNGRS